MKNMKHALYFLMILITFKPLMCFGQANTQVPSNPNLKGEVTIRGMAEFNQTLTVNTSDLKTSQKDIYPKGFKYKWKSGTKVIIETDLPTYTLVEKDIGSQLSVEVTASNCKGSKISLATDSVKKASQTTPEAPKMESNTTNSITLTTVSGAQYRKGSGTWQNSPIFKELKAGTYSFTQRMKETTTHLASSESSVSNFSTVPETPPELSGTVTINGTEEFNQTLEAVTSALTSSLGDTKPTGFTYIWKRGTINIKGATSSTYKLAAEDIGNTIAVEVFAENCKGSVQSKTTTSIKKASQATPEAPKMESNTINSITLTTVSGAQYSKEGAPWENTPTFTGLKAGIEYSFTQRMKETTTHLASSESSASKFSTAPETPPELLGTVTISGTLEFNQTLIAVTSALTSSHKDTKPTGFTYQWKRGKTNIRGATSSTYKLTAEDIDEIFTVEVSASNCLGSVTSTSTAPVKKAMQPPPAAPTMASISTNSITLTTVSGAQYRMGSGTWQNSPTFTGLMAGTMYSFTQRMMETTTYLASNESKIASFEVSRIRTVTGTVFDDYGSPLQSVTVRLKDSTNGVTTDVKGKFIINFPAESATLVFYLDGFNPREVNVSDKQTLDVFLWEKPKGFWYIAATGGVSGFGTYDLSEKKPSGKAFNFGTDVAYFFKPMFITDPYIGFGLKFNISKCDVNRGSLLFSYSDQVIFIGPALYFKWGGDFNFSKWLSITASAGPGVINWRLTDILEANVHTDNEKHTVFGGFLSAGINFKIWKNLEAGINVQTVLGSFKDQYDFKRKPTDFGVTGGLNLRF